MVIKREIVYPIFINCVQYCENKFWTSIFEDLAYGKCPNGTFIHKNFFTSNYKGKEFSYKIEETDAKIIYENIYNLLTKKLKILSDEDRKAQLLDYIKLENEVGDIRHDKWSNIKKKSTKDSLIEQYIIDIKKTWDLNDKQVKKLQKQINLGLIFKTISHKDIIIIDGKIDKIMNIEFYPKGYEFTIDLIKSEEIDLLSDNGNDIFYLSDLWYKEFTNTSKEIVEE